MKTHWLLGMQVSLCQKHRKKICFQLQLKVEVIWQIALEHPTRWRRNSARCPWRFLTGDTADDNLGITMGHEVVHGDRRKHDGRPVQRAPSPCAVVRHWNRKRKNESKHIYKLDCDSGKFCLTVHNCLQKLQEEENGDDAGVHYDISLPATSSSNKVCGQSLIGVFGTPHQKN